MRKFPCLLFIVSFFIINLNLKTYASPEEKDNFLPKYSIKLTGGWNYVRFGDINKAIGSFNNNDLFKDVRNNAPELIIGEIIKLKNFAPDWEAELRIDIAPEIAVSLACSGPIRRINESSLTYTYRGSAGDQICTYTFLPEIKVTMPVRLGFHYILPYSSRANVIFNGGIAYYSAKASEYRKLELTTPSGFYEWVTHYWWTKNKLFSGFNVGIGMEYSLIKNLILVVEVRGRYAKVKGLKGTMQSEDLYSGILGEEEGTLYYFNMWDDGIGVRYDDLAIWEEPPERSIGDFNNIREAFLDLSGFSINIGMRIKLF